MYYIGYDIGSSSIKAALVHSDTGEHLALVKYPKEELPIISLHKGWAEQDPDSWWKNVCVATREILDKTKINPQNILGIGIAYQMHGLVLVDIQGNLLRNSIIWCDSRAIEIGQKAFESLGEAYCSEELLNSPGNFTASKLKWVKDNEPDIYSKIHKIMLPGDYIAFKFSGEKQTTVPGLSEGILWNYKTREPATKLMDHYGLGMQLLPELVDTCSLQARVSQKGATASGLSEGTPIYYRAGDQPNNALSLNVFEPGQVAATGGTSGVFYAVTDSLSVKEYARVNNFVHVNHRVDKLRLGKLLCINGAGILYNWVRKNLDVDSYEEMNRLAEEIPVGSEGLAFLPFGNGAERMLDNRLIGAHLCNLNLNLHNSAHICRAALEGIAFSFVYGMEILKSDGIKPRVIRAGNDNLFRSAVFSETIATLIAHDIEIYNTTGAVGAARACQLHTGDFKNFGDQVLKNDFLQRIIPKKDKSSYIEAYQNWKKELQHKLSNT
ncbi:MAG: carbohydrate kinase [Eudoraea sp.]|nr:carbohydrate kinase [Eudoraea sp.]NNJ39616.1 carbohydrate kinase [Eudoraea sp.]